MLQLNGLLQGENEEKKRAHKREKVKLKMLNMTDIYPLIQRHKINFLQI